MTPQMFWRVVSGLLTALAALVAFGFVVAL